MAGPDPKQGKRIIDKSAIERKMMDELQCRACGPNGISSRGNRAGRLEAHHLVNRSQLGDDVEANIVGLCPVCHFTFTHEGGNSARVVARRIRSNMSQSERGYVVRKKSFEWLEQHYPRFESQDRTGWPVGSSETMPEPTAKVVPVVSDSSAEPRTREGREGHPSVLVSSADKPGGVEQPSRGAAPPSGAGLKRPQPGGEAVADRDKSDRCQRGTPTSGQRLRDDGQAGRSFPPTPRQGNDTNPPRSSESIPTVTPYWLEPGVDCPTCHRKIPHAKKESTPKARTWGFKIPEDEREAFETNLETVEKIIGVYERPYAHFQTVVAMLGYILMNHEDEFRRFLSV